MRASVFPTYAPFMFCNIQNNHRCTGLIYFSASLNRTLYLFFLLQTPEELDDSDFETEDFDVRSRTSVQTEDDQLIAGQSARVSVEFLLVMRERESE